MEELKQLVKDLLSEAVAERDNRPQGDARHPITIAHRGMDWLKVFVAILIQTCAIVYSGTRAYDSHDSRIAAIEKATTVIPSMQADISNIREVVGRIDERTKAK